MPDRDYYTKTDAKSEELRGKYVAHVQKMLELGGAPADAAAADAKTIMELETKLAEASQSKVDIRNPDKTYHPMTVAAFAKEAPNYAWPAYFAEQKRSGRHLGQRLAAGLLPGDGQAPRPRCRSRRGRRTCAGACSPRPRRR